MNRNQWMTYPEIARRVAVWRDVCERDQGTTEPDLLAALNVLDHAREVLSEIIAEWETPDDDAPHGRLDTGGIAMARDFLAAFDGQPADIKGDDR